MTTRDNALLALRPILTSIRETPQTGAEEQFQNHTLRPIIKLQNDLIILMFKNYIKKRKNVFFTLTLDKQLDYISHSISRDIKFRNSLKGILIGQFTTAEYTAYIKNSSVLNKRMMNLVTQRLQSQIQLFTIPVTV